MPVSASSSTIIRSLLEICYIASLFLDLSCVNARLILDGHLGSTTLTSSRPQVPEQNVSIYNMHIKRSDFPKGFLFGISTSAAQIEGSAREGGRGPSIWDYFVQRFPEKIIDGGTMDVTIDSYKRYKEDVRCLKKLGVDAYRFSISWTRILPEGTLSGGVNKEGIDYYNNMINDLIQNGIKPFVTIFHFDSPQTLQDKYGGFLSRAIIDDFKDYSEVCFKAFGDRVKHWITINEPLVIAQCGHDNGIGAPGRCSQPVGACLAGNSSIEPYIVSHYMLLAHATVFKLYKDKYQPIQGGEIGIAHVGQYYEPYSESKEDRSAQERAMEFTLGWYLEPMVYGDYPKSMKLLVQDRLPKFTEEEKKLVKGSFDFIGINYYTTRYARSLPIKLNVPHISASDDSYTTNTVDREGIPIGPLAGGIGYVYVYPIGLQKILEHIKIKYQSPPIIITENGVPEARDDRVPKEVVLKDIHRINFILQHFQRILNSIRNGVNVKGYFYWSAFDDFEWIGGYTTRFGLYYIDFTNNMERIPKMSAKWFRDFLRQQQEEGTPLRKTL